jgi:hypothetical protein
MILMKMILTKQLKRDDRMMYFRGRIIGALRGSSYAEHDRLSAG